MSSDVISMFPTLVWRVELDDPVREAIETKGIAALARMRRDLAPLEELLLRADFRSCPAGRTYRARRRSEQVPIYRRVAVH